MQSKSLTQRSGRVLTGGLILDFRFWILDFGFQVSDFKLKMKMKVKMRIGIEIGIESIWTGWTDWTDWTDWGLLSREGASTGVEEG